MKYNYRYFKILE